MTWSLLTSAGDVVLDTKVSIWASWVVAGREDDATHCLDFADHTGHCWSGHDAILTNHQMVDLHEGGKSKTLFHYELLRSYLLKSDQKMYGSDIVW